MYTIEVDGFDEILSRFAAGDRLADGVLTGAMAQAVELVGNDAAIPAPESDSNQPPPPYYIRGIGTQYEGGNRGESQDIRNKWEKTIEKQDDGIIGTVENKVSYAPWVHSMTRQIPIHTSREWRKVDKIAQDTQKRVFEFFEQAARNWAAYMRK